MKFISVIEDNPYSLSSLAYLSFGSNRTIAATLHPFYLFIRIVTKLSFSLFLFPFVLLRSV